MRLFTMLFTTSRYFTLMMLAFLASFLLLPSSKAVNNFYYVFIALPALVLFIRGKVPRPNVTLLLGLWGALFFWLLIGGVFVVWDGQFLRHFLYTLLFCAIILLWVDQKRFEKDGLFRVFFWSLIVYVVVSTLYLWFVGEFDLGVRIVDLPAPLSGPILTSMLIVSCFALLTPTWLKNRCWIEMTIAVIAVMLCVGFILQSRSGLVGLAVALSVILGVLFRRGDWRGRSVLLGFSVLAVFGVLWAYDSSDVVARLVTRADSGRFELWQAYLGQWRDCGLFLGCGPSFAGDIYIQNGMYIYHPHNVFLAMGFYHGFPALLLFVLAMFVTVWEAVKQRNPWGFYLAVALLMLNFDGSRVVESPREVWLLVWLPAMLITARHHAETVRTVRSRAGEVEAA